MTSLMDHPNGPPHVKQRGSWQLLHGNRMESTKWNRACIIDTRAYLVYTVKPTCFLFFSATPDMDYSFVIQGRPSEHIFRFTSDILERIQTESRKC